MMSLEYLFDECIDERMVDLLEKEEPAVPYRQVGKVGGPSKGTKDPELLQFAEDGKYVLVTGDRSTMPAHIAEHFGNGGHTRGVFILRKKADFDLVVQWLIEFWATEDPIMLVDKTVYLS